MDMNSQEKKNAERIKSFEDTVRRLEEKLKAGELAVAEMTNTLTICKSILGQSLAGVYMINNNLFSYVNQSFADIFGYASPEEIVGKMSITELVAPESRALVAENVRRRTTGEINAIRYEFTGLRKDGSRIIVEVHGRSMLIDDKRSVIGIILDMTDYRRMSTLAFFDSLSGLPNRALFHDRLDQAIALARRGNGHFALMFIDLDGFKKVNDSFGHVAGDHVLRESAQRLKKLFRNSDTVARIGGDEFAVILTGAAGRNISVQLANKILEQLETPILFSGQGLIVSASIGISLFPQDGAEADSLLRNADMAMYEAKKRGKHTYHFAS